ncbi:hypothetical protein LK542_23885 [Massilia sp. IC2-477]|uniref:hypothetical protein n=1 Tax=Massilia sp. IC2-477 TaxID=2887198 RepID=UPI001D12B7F1|nr:hypothetical protein [Massilia sp. IC2-477]MCC2958657.1 hypothetical protein [Massilia sp. IC2-477]
MAKFLLLASTILLSVNLALGAAPATAIQALKEHIGAICLGSPAAGADDDGQAE